MNKDIFSQLKSIEDGMNSLLGAMSSLTHSKYTFQDNYDEVWTPNCDVYISNMKLHIVIELAGITKDSLELVFNDKYLLLRGTRDFGVPSSDVCFYHMEIETGAFERVIYFPEVQLDKEKPKVNFENGILKIQFDILEEKEAFITVE
ncbi:Hsp20/alpha crystallin family protein [bacterium]|nr:Hsp20/alpha crystallin family protein [bacterium]